MRRSCLLTLCLLACLIVSVLPVQAQLPQISSGLNYLTTAQTQDGTWQSETVEGTAATLSALDTLKLLGQTASTTYINGTTWLQAQTPLSVNYMAERLRVLGISDVGNLLSSTDTIKGGWGGDEGYEVNQLDTSFALQALKAAGYTDASIYNQALAYLIANQNSDGGWGFTQGSDSSIYMTAMVSVALQQFPQVTTIATAVGKATAYLLAHQNLDGGFGSSSSTIYETALAYTALVAVSSNTAALSNAVTYLTTSQATNGSWNDDSYATALALKALYLFENKPPSPPPPPEAGTITGVVIDSITKQKVTGVSVVLESNQLVNATTDANGTFTLNDVTPGSQKLLFSLAGYASNSAITAVTANAMANVGTIMLVSAATTGTIAGVITDNTGKPLSGVAISVTGSWSGTGTTNADGSYSFTYVTPGSVTLTATKTGYQTVTAPGTVYARTTLTFSPRLSTGTSSQTTGTLVGRVVDSYWGVPIDHLPEETGVQVIVSGASPVAVDADNGGYFTIPNLQPGTYQVIVGMHGFASKVFRVVITAGTTTDLGTIRLEMSFVMTLTGKVTDAKSGLPIPGAEITLAGTTFTGRADVNGFYGIADIPSQKTYTVKTAATGYVGKSYTVGTTSWIQTMDVALTPIATKGSLSGMVVDASTGQPVVGATLTLVSDPSLTTLTDQGGSFVLAEIPKGPQQVTVTLGGYSPRTVTVTIIAGGVVNAGKIALSTTVLPAAIQGIVWDGWSNTPFAGATVQVNHENVSLQTTTASDGTYLFSDVQPGAVTVAATSTTKTGYYEARIIGQLEPGGLLIFSPTLATIAPSAVDVAVKSDKSSYIKGETAHISVQLQNKDTSRYTTILHLQVRDPSGATVFDKNESLELQEEGSLVQEFLFELANIAQAGTYSIKADLFDDSGRMIGTGTGNFGVATSQVTMTPSLPASFAVGNNTVLFSLSNTGTLPVSSGTVGVQLKDPDGQVVSSTSWPFSLDAGAVKTVAATIAIPTLKFGTYTLTYAQSDETKDGLPVSMSLSNTISIAALFDNNSHRIRETAGLSVALVNTGRFAIDTTGAGTIVAVSVPDAGYSENKPLAPAPSVGDAVGSSLLYRFVIPESMTAGIHGAKITVTLPSGSVTNQTAQLAIAGSSLALLPVPSSFTAGATISPAIANNGGVDTQVQHKLSLYDAKAALISENSGNGTATAGANYSLSLAIPAGAVDGAYSLAIQFKDMTTGKESITSYPITINGVKGGLQVKTDKESYLATESITGISSLANSGSSPLQNGKLHLQVTTASGEQKIKTWTTQADFQTGVRNGVDTYGVNDWIIPDDDFEGTAVNGDRWESNVYNGGAIPIITGEQLQLDTTGAIASVSEVASNFHLEGDFDVQVDYEIKLFTNYNSHALLAAYFDDGSYFRVGRQGSYYQSYRIWPDENRTTSSSDIKGKFRLTRAANVAKTWYWNGSQWINQATWTVSTAPVTIHLQAASHLGTEQVHAKFDNFKVNSGRIKTENQTVDSVRLLPLNDNFDDGVLNTDRWNIRGVTGYLPLEAGGTMKFVLPPNLDADTATSLRSRVTGNFNVSINYSVISSWASPDNHAVSFDMSVPNYWMEMIHWRSPYYSGPAYGAVGANNPSTWTFAGNAPLQGKFKFDRFDGNYTSYYWSEFGWTKLLSETGNSPYESAALSFGARVAPRSGQFEVLYDNFKVSSQNYSTSGTLNLKQDSGSSITKWGKLTFSSTQPAGTAIKFRTRTADTEAGLATALWSDYLSASGSDIASPAARWIEVEATLSTTDANATPLLHDLSVSYGSNAGQILWQTDVPVELAPSAVADLNNVIGTLGVTGKFYLEGTLSSSSGQIVASADYPFYIASSNMLLVLNPDKKLYKPGETVTIAGEVRNLTEVDAANLAVSIKASPANGTQQTVYEATITVPAGGGYPLSVTTVAGADGTVVLNGMVVQNGTIVAEMADQYEIAGPQVSASVAAPDSVGNDPFILSITLANSGKTAAVVSVTNSFGAPLETVSIPAGETKLLNYTQQTTADTLYTFTFSGDLNQTLSKQVSYRTVPVIQRTVAATVVVDKIAYAPNEAVAVTAAFTSATANIPLSNLVAKTTILGSTGQSLFSDTKGITTLLGGQRLEIKSYWNSADNPKGTYSVRVELSDGTTSLAVAESSFTINSSADSGAGLSGAIAAQTTTVEMGQDATLLFTVANKGNESLADIAPQIVLVDPESGQAINTMSILGGTLLLAINESKSDKLTIATSSLPMRPLLAVLQATVSGTVKTLASATFTVVDTTLPTLVVSALSDGSVTQNETLNLAGTATDNSGIKELLINGTVVPVAQDNSFSYAVVLKTGDNLIQTVVTDLAGNQTTDSRTIRLDQTAPELTISTPADNSKTAVADLQLSGTLNETATVSVKLADAEQPVSLNDTGFSAQLVLKPGINTIIVTATDLAGNSSSLKRTVIYDDQKPSLAVTVPAQDIRTNQADVTIVGTVSDPYTAVAVSITVDGITYTPAVVDGQFEQPLTFSEEKNYAIIVTATNEAGTSTVVQRNVIYDITPPGFTLNPVISPTQAAEQVVSGTREAGSTVMVTCSTAVVGTVAYPDDTTWQVGITNLTVGDNPITAVATDETGNSSTLTTQITYTLPSQEPLFGYAIFGNSGINVAGAVLTDSYRTGICSGHNKGSIGTNATQRCAIRLTGAAIIRGKALVGSGGNPSQGICLTGLTAITAGLGTLEKPKPMQPVSDPGGGQNMGSLNLSGNKGKTLGEGTYRFSSLSLSGTTVLTITGKTTIIVDGTFSVTGCSRIEIPSSASLTLYLNGQTLNISGSALLNRSLQPQRLVVYGTPGLKNIKLSGIANLHGLIYAPSADITMSGALQLFGAVVGNNVTIEGGSAVHFDETLLEN